MSIQILDDMAEITEEHVGIIYSVDNITEVIVHKIGNWSVIESLWYRRRKQYKEIEAVLADVNEKYHLLKLPSDDPEMPGLHNVSRLEGYLIRKGIHPLNRTERLKQQSI